MGSATTLGRSGFASCFQSRLESLDSSPSAEAARGDRTSAAAHVMSASVRRSSILRLSLAAGDHVSSAVCPHCIRTAAGARCRPV